MVHVDTRSENLFIFDGFPCDRLSMEPSLIMQALLNQKPGVCWAVYVPLILVARQKFPLHTRNRATFWILEGQGEFSSYVFATLQLSTSF